MDLLDESVNPKHKVNQIALRTQVVSTHLMPNVMFNVIFLALSILINYVVSNCIIAGGLDGFAAISVDVL